MASVLVQGARVQSFRGAHLPDRWSHCGLMVCGHQSIRLAMGGRGTARCSCCAGARRGAASSCVGGGGGGRDYNWNTSSKKGGGGGGAGSHVSNSYDISAATSVSLNITAIGAGGAGMSSSRGNGGAGGTGVLYGAIQTSGLDPVVLKTQSEYDLGVIGDGQLYSSFTMGQNTVYTHVN